MQKPFKIFTSRSMVRIKPYLSKVNFLLGRNPVVERRTDFRRFIPSPYRTVVLISADFELAWAPRYDKKATAPLDYALELARRERDNLPNILALTEQYTIPITWATVGHLFLESCRSENGRKHPEIPAVANYEGPFWDFSGSDWFEYDPCTECSEAPEWYAPDLLRSIIDNGAGHEIGCHTFSHIDCRDGVCAPELMRAELQTCKQIAASWGLSLESFVHPGHTIGNLEVLAQEGFTNYRTDYRNVLGYPRRDASGLWEFEQTAEFNWRNGWSAKYHIYRYTEIIRRAMASNTVCVFWFHPSFDSRIVSEVWPAVFRFLDERRDSVWVTTHGAYVEFLNQSQP